jgi:hypothetical protein
MAQTRRVQWRTAAEPLFYRVIRREGWFGQKAAPTSQDR